MRLLLVFIASSLLAQQANVPKIPELMPRDKEIEMALAAAPAHLRAEAGVYVLGQKGFEKVRDSSNGFTCIVNRDHPMNLKPTCWDAEGSRTIVPKVLRVGELLMLGKSLPEIGAEIREGFKSGKYQAPQRPGVAYMLSGDVRNFNPQTGATSSFPPHIMFYAPNMTNKDIASDGSMDMPFIAYQGPHGYMIVMASHSGH